VSLIPGILVIMSRWLTEDEQRAWRGLLRMTSQLNARMNRQLQDDDVISLADYDVLVLLSEIPQGRLRVFEMADALAWEQSRVSHQLARMQRRGLVAREECPTDARGAFVVLTEAGRAAIERAAPAHVEMVRQLVFDGLSRDQLSALTAVSDRVLDRLRGADDDVAGPEPAAYDD
jgi:DNA-binding MarR family transcriptional regulator